MGVKSEIVAAAAAQMLCRLPESQGSYAYRPQETKQQACKAGDDVGNTSKLLAWNRAS